MAGSLLAMWLWELFSVGLDGRGVVRFAQCGLVVALLDRNLLVEIAIAVALEP